jgi:hypothetical protein
MRFLVFELAAKIAGNTFHAAIAKEQRRGEYDLKGTMRREQGTGNTGCLDFGFCFLDIP